MRSGSSPVKHHPKPLSTLMGFQNMYIAASAGAGKTYQLVGRFVALLCIEKLREQHEGTALDVSKLIAITFTRKAAGEFKDRILADLAAAAQSEETAQAFWQQRIAVSMEDLGGSLPCPMPAQTFFLELLRDIMKQFSSLNLGTIDGLFQRMVRSLSTELGLQQIELMDPSEQESHKRHALNDCYLHYQESLRESEDEVHDLQAAILASLGEDSKLKSPDFSIFELISTYHALYLQNPDILWGGRPEEMSEEQLAVFGLSKDIITPRLSEEELIEQVRLFRKYFEEPIDALPEPEKIGKADGGLSVYSVGKSPIEVVMHHNSKRAYRNAFIRFATSLADIGRPIAFVDVKGLSDPRCPERAMEESRYPQYWSLCAERGIILNDMLQANRAHSWQQLLRRTHAIKKLLAHFESIYNKEVRQSGIYNFSDMEAVLQDRVDNEHFQLVQERMDARLQHWLLDEFQDTSYGQYNILRDLLLNRAQGDEDGSVFMVGDAKQSIYQFRGGDPKIFIRTRQELFGLDTAGQESSREKPLNVSYRSSQAVLDLPNRIFGDDFEHLASLASPTALSMWRDMRYEKHLAAQTKLSGETRIWNYQGQKDEHPTEGDESISDQEALLITIAEQLERIRPQGGNNTPSCALLVSTKKEGMTLCDKLKELQESYAFEGPVVLSDDNYVGTDSPLGKALIYLFRWLNSPGDKKSLSQLKLHPIWDILQRASGQEQMWLKLRCMIEAGGYSHLLKYLFEQLEDMILSSEFFRQRWKTWLDSAASFDARGKTLGEWIDYMEQVVIREEPQGKAIRIMTIHKSKGLEFDCVMLPFFPPTQAMAKHNRFKLLSYKDDDGQCIATIIPPTAQMSTTVPRFYQGMMEPIIAQEEFASFCKLYVAITRAKRATYIFLPAPKKSSSEPSKASLVHMLRQLYPELSKDQMAQFGWDQLSIEVYAQGQSSWYQEQSKTNISEISIREPEFPMGDYHFESLERSTPSALDKDRRHEDPEPLTAAHRSLGESRGAQFGTLVHQLLQEVSWLEEEQPTWEWAEEQASATAHRAIHSRAWRPFMSKPHEDCHLYREQNIEALMEDKWVSGQIDRMVISYAHGYGQAATSAHIMDFKTDAQLSEREGKRHYRSQMKAYRRMLALAFQLPEAAVQVTLLHCPAFGEPEAWTYGEDDWTS